MKKKYDSVKNIKLPTRKSLSTKAYWSTYFSTLLQIVIPPQRVVIATTYTIKRNVIGSF